MLLSELTTMRVGGPATRLVRATTADELVAEALATWADGDEWFVLGGGSNVVFADEGFDGTVIRVESRGIDATVEGHDVRLRVQAGESWDALVALTVERGWAGLEALSGIPGTVGASPIQNIGAYGQEVSGSIVSVDFLDYLEGSQGVLWASDLGFGYRTSAIKRGRQGIILAVEFELRDTVGMSDPIAYPQLAAALDVELGASVPLQDVRDAVLALRASKGMVSDPVDPDTWSCGSFFTNPIVSANFARGLPNDAPRWAVDPEPAAVAVPLGAEPAPPPPVSGAGVKLSAAWLIEHAGVERGFALPGSRAAVSSKHSLAITNRGGASEAEVTELARFIQAQVQSRFGVLLQPEPTVF